MTMGASEDFWGPSLAPARAPLEKLDAQERFIQAAFLMVGAIIVWFVLSSTDSDPVRGGTKGAVVGSLLFAWGLWSLVKALRGRARVEPAEPPPAGGVVWYRLDDSGLSILEDPTVLRTTSGLVIPWTAMESLVLVNEVSQRLLLAYRLPGMTTETRADLVGATKRSDGITFRERIRELYDLKVAGVANPSAAAPAMARS